MAKPPAKCVEAGVGTYCINHVNCREGLLVFSSITRSFRHLPGALGSTMNPLLAVISLAVISRTAEACWTSSSEESVPPTTTSRAGLQEERQHGFVNQLVLPTETAFFKFNVWVNGTGKLSHLFVMYIIYPGSDGRAEERWTCRVLRFLPPGRLFSPNSPILG